jgi:CheY-like chemotaxis protein
MNRRILLVDDNEAFLDSTLDVLEDMGYEVTTANSGEDAVKKLDASSFHAVLMDVKMPGMSGVESFLEMREKDPGVNVILCTAYPLEGLMEKALRQGVKDVLTKPLKMTKLLATLENP